LIHIIADGAIILQEGQSNFRITLQLLMCAAMADNHDRVVAVIDDDAAVLDSLKFLLEIRGHAVAAYASAAAFLNDHTMDPACLILDHRMPQMTGLELAARLRAAGRSIPILLLSAQLSSAIIAQADKLGIEKVLSKPAAKDELLRFIDSHH
jgi:two-component system, LuxR family, response regulator FixJ